MRLKNCLWCGSLSPRVLVTSPLVSTRYIACRPWKGLGLPGEDGSVLLGCCSSFNCAWHVLGQEPRDLRHDRLAGDATWTLAAKCAVREMSPVPPQVTAWVVRMGTRTAGSSWIGHLLGLLRREAALELDDGGDGLGDAHGGAAGAKEHYASVLQLRALRLHAVDEPAWHLGTI